MTCHDFISTETATPLEVYLVGARYTHHAEHSGYEGFGRHIGSALRAPVTYRWLDSKRFPQVGWKLDFAIARTLNRKGYSAGLLLTELNAMLHMVSHRRALYHLLYGDTDLCLLGRAGRISRNRVVATFHEPPTDLEEMVSPRLLNCLDGIIIVSEFQRQFFERHVERERIFVAHHGVDTTFFHPAKERSPEPTFITVGKHLRDFETLGRTIDTVLSRRPDARFVAVGTDGEKGRPPFRHPRVEHLRGIDDEELRRRYQSSWATILCFSDVTANNAVLEAISCGVPVIVTDVGGIREYVGDVGAALLCPRSDPDAMSAAVLNILEQSTSLAKAMRDAARKRALAFDYRLAARRQAEIYTQVLSAASGRHSESRCLDRNV